MYTFWDYRRNRWQRDAGLRIDHLLLNPKAAKHLVDAGVLVEATRRSGSPKILAERDLFGRCN
jgi:exonuclease III